MPFLTVPQLLDSAVARFADAPALVTADRSETFGELGANVSAVARTLQERGVKSRDRVLIAAPNSIALVHTWLGSIVAGAIPAAVNPDSKQAELDYFSKDLDPRLTLLEQDLDSLPPPSWGRVGVGAAAVDPLDTAAIVYTSGTTSRPKGVMVRHAAYTEAGSSFPQWLGLRGRQRLWACLPMFHINAQAYSLMSSLSYGFPLALSSKFHASTFWQEARDLEVTSVNMVGAMLQFLAHRPATSFQPVSLKTIYAAPGPQPEERAQLEARFGVRIITGFGMSENPFGCIETESSRGKPNSIGRPRQPVSKAFTNRLRILRSDGAQAAVGETGELCFQNPVMTPGYWNAPEITEKALSEGWLHSGDAGYVDPEGDVFLTGRYKEMIRRRGENIAPAEIEDVLAGHPAVYAAAVIGIAAGLEEEEVVAVVVPKEGATVDEAGLKAFAAERLAAFKVPTRIELRAELPMTATHRVAKDVLRKEYARPG